MTIDRELSQAARRVGRTLNAGVFLDRAALATAALFCAVATAWVALKTLVPSNHLMVLWGFAALPVAWLGVYLRCKRAGLFFTEYECLALADRHAFNNGALVSAAEDSRLDGGAGARLALARLARREESPARLAPSVYAKRLSLPVLYLAAVALAPQSIFPRPAATEVVDREVDILSETLEQNELLPEEVREELLEKLREIQEEKEELSQEQWDALEAARDKIANAFDSEAAKLAVAERRVEALEKEMAEAMAKEDFGDKEATDLAQAAEEALEALMNANLSTPEAQELMKEAREKLEKLKSECENGQKPGDGKKKEGGKRPNPGDLKKKLDELKKKLSESKKECEGKSGQCKNPGKKPGKGGIDRGRADADMEYSEEPREIDAEYQLEMIDLQFNAPEDSMTIDITYVEPPKEGLDEDSGQRVARRGSLGLGGDASATFISPSQKDVVERYFASEK